MKRTTRVLTTVAAVVAGPAAAIAVAVPAHASTAYGYAEFNADGVRIRACASTACAVRGLGYRSHSVSWFCGSQTADWVHIRDNTTGVEGWSSKQYVYYGCE